MEKYHGAGQPQMTIWHMCIACWTLTATHTHSGQVIHIAFPLQQWLHQCTSMLHYMYIACLVKHLLVLLLLNIYIATQLTIISRLTMLSPKIFDPKLNSTKKKLSVQSSSTRARVHLEIYFAIQCSFFFSVTKWIRTHMHRQTAWWSRKPTFFLEEREVGYKKD